MNRVIKSIKFKTFTLSLYMKIGSYISRSCGYSLESKRLILYMMVFALNLSLWTPAFVIDYISQ